MFSGDYWGLWDVVWETSGNYRRFLSLKVHDGKAHVPWRGVALTLLVYRTPEPRPGLFWHACCSNVAQASCGNIVPSDANHDLTGMRLSNSGAPMRWYRPFHHWSVLLSNGWRDAFKKRSSNKRNVKNDISGSTSERSQNCCPRTALPVSCLEPLGA